MRRLPVLAAVRHIAETVFNNIGVAFRLSWPWLLVLTAAAAIFALQMPMIDAGSANPPTSAQAAQYSFLAFALALVSLVAFSSIAVNWHRYVLRDEVPSGAGLLRLDGHVWRYIGNSILAGLIMMIPIAVIGIPVMSLMQFTAASPTDGNMASYYLSLWPMFILMIVVGAFMYRLLIKLPAVAIGRADYGFQNALGDTKGNFLEMVGFMLVFTLVLLIASLLLGAVNYALISALGAAGAFIGFLLNVGYQWLSLIVGISALTSLYGFFAEKRDF